MKRLTTRQRIERMVKRYEFRGWDIKAGVEAPYIEATDAIRLLLAEHRRLRATVRKLHQRYTTGIYGDSPVDYFVEDLLKAMR